MAYQTGPELSIINGSSQILTRLYEEMCKEVGVGICTYVHSHCYDFIGQKGSIVPELNFCDRRVTPETAITKGRFEMLEEVLREWEGGRWPQWSRFGPYGGGIGASIRVVLGGTGAVTCCAGVEQRVVDARGWSNVTTLVWLL